MPLAHACIANPAHGSFCGRLLARRASARPPIALRLHYILLSLALSGWPHEPARAALVALPFRSLSPSGEWQRPASGKTCHLYVSFLESYMDQLRDLGKAFAIEAGVESTISNGGAARGIGAARPSSAKQQSPVRPTSAKAGGAGGAFRPASAGPRGMVAHSSDGALVELPSLEIHEAADKSV